ncbi:flagellar hook-length control protein FliK, partial [Duganella sp. S19_KUP01_CR8]|uniref:flagellar hook-length control protein FliK n=1 Tax=Duganella sp. S19_KUP01_CR8 TaxID=3025502 RepID=UPI002FCD9C4F
MPALNIDRSLPLLVVDDNQQMRSVVKGILADLGFVNVYLAGSGEEACRILAERPIAAVISDLDMPGMNGLQLLQWVRSNLSDIELPFMLLPSEANRDGLRAAAQAGVTDCLIKPFTLATFHSKLQAMFQSRGDAADRRAAVRRAALPAAATLEADTLKTAQAGADANAAADFKAALTKAGSTAQTAADAAAAAAAAAKAATAASTTTAAVAASAAPVKPVVADSKPVSAIPDGPVIDTLSDTTDAAPAEAAEPAAPIKVGPGMEHPDNVARATPRQSDPLQPVFTGKTTQPTEAAPLLKEAAPAITIAPSAQSALEAAKTAVSAVPTDKLSSRVGTQAWDQQLGQKIIFMAAGGEQSATMELNPPDLGPLQVVLSINKDQATAAFSSAQPEVRQALEAAMPKLREMMSEAGIQLGNATVSAGMSNQNNGFNQQASSAHSGGGQRSGASLVGDSGGGSEAPRSAPPARRVPAGA